jgi:elongation factor P--(R)-beta-lysine ligase
MQALAQRQKLYQYLRRYFAAQNVLEVETPILDIAGNTDPAIMSFQTSASDARPLWLRTSPEFFHKRLLAAGSGSIFELAKVFRSEEESASHHREFTMLEYYRIGFDEHALMACLAALIAGARAEFGLPALPVVHLRYQDWFQAELALEPLSEPLPALQARVQALGVIGQYGRDDCLDLLRTHVLEARLNPQVLTFIHDFPASQAALAELNTDGLTARRFELFSGGFELANGYFELTDASEQRARFSNDQRKRAALGMPEVAQDQALLAALAKGLPTCAGVAVGVDRLLMILTNASLISQLHAWDHSSAAASRPC